MRRLLLLRSCLLYAWSFLHHQPESDVVFCEQLKLMITTGCQSNSSKYIRLSVVQPSNRQNELKATVTAYLKYRCHMILFQPASLSLASSHPVLQLRHHGIGEAPKGSVSSKLNEHQDAQDAVAWSLLE